MQTDDWRARRWCVQSNVDDWWDAPTHFRTDWSRRLENRQAGLLARRYCSLVETDQESPHAESVAGSTKQDLSHLTIYGETPCYSILHMCLHYCVGVEKDAEITYWRHQVNHVPSTESADVDNCERYWLVVHQDFSLGWNQLKSVRPHPTGDQPCVLCNRR